MKKYSLVVHLYEDDEIIKAHAKDFIDKTAAEHEHANIVARLIGDEENEM